MTRPRVLLDADDVLLDFIRPAIQLINEITGGTHKIADLKGKWDLFDGFGITDEDVRFNWFAEVRAPYFCASLAILPGARDAVSALRQISDVYVVTSPMSKAPTWAHERLESLEKHFGFTKDHVVSTGAKYLVAGDVLVDDSTDNLERWLSMHPHGHAVRFDQLPNPGRPFAGVTTDDWSVVLDIVANLGDRTEYRKWTHLTT